MSATLKNWNSTGVVLCSSRIGVLCSTEYHWSTTFVVQSCSTEKYFVAQSSTGAVLCSTD